ncbi:MAG TPA: hypothetical protein DCX07_02560 [Phycisphaerales bacterium]|nr:hypothetical protein [Phycisphaerales bacterium]
MTFRAVLIGLLGAVFIAGLGYFDEQVWFLESLTSGHLLPISVFGSLFVFMVVVNPLLSRAGRLRLALTPSELAVVVGLMLVACSVPGGGFLRTFPSTIAMPAHINLLSPGWKKHDLLNYVPPRMLPAGGQYDETVTGGYVGGLGSSDHPIGMDQVPWWGWAGPLRTWIPLVLLMGVASICLSLIVHRQWTSLERLRYPIAEFANSLLEQDDHGWGPVFRDRFFWGGFLAVLILRLVNGLHAWFPESMVEIPLVFDFTPIGAKYPSLLRAPWGWNLLQIAIHPIAVAFCFYLASDIALSLGLTQFLVIPLSAFLLTEGVDISSGYMEGGMTAWQRFGSFLAFVLALLYMGRRYYFQVLKQALGLGRRGEGVDSYAVWALRFLVLVCVAMVVLVCRLGVDWPMSVLTILLSLLLFLGTARISAETGLFFIMPRWMPVSIVLSLFGAYAMGPKALLIVGLFSAVMTLDPSQSLMPYFVNGLRICDRSRVPPGRMGWAGVGIFAIALAVATPIAIWANYRHGTNRDWWHFGRVPRMAFDLGDSQIASLEAAGQLDESQSLSTMDRLRSMKPDRRFVYSVLAGFALVLLVGAMRLRYVWWPIHPVIFLVWSTWPMVRLSHSFLLGWLLKITITRFGGHRAYSAAKKAMVGVIAAELLAGLLFMIVGAIYYFVTGYPPVLYEVIPD